MNHFNNDWDTILGEEMVKDYYIKLSTFLTTEYETQTIYPPKEDIFTAFHLTPYNSVKVVILGQDPYHGVNQAHGLSFSVRKGNKTPPSLRNIYKEIGEDCGTTLPTHGELSSWAEQGVLLMNTCLTVREGKPNSHKNKGWEKLTDQVMVALNGREEPIVFILWGGNAKSKQSLITNPHHLVLTSVHPSPLSAHQGFFGNHHFTITNDFLAKHGLSLIDWQIM